jgi:hypothetical protein
MKFHGKRPASQSIEITPDAEPSVRFPFPPPDACTRVSVDLEPSSAWAREISTSAEVDGGQQRPPAGRIISIGLATVIVAVGSSIAGETGILQVPMSASLGVAGAGGLLLAFGGVRRWQRTQHRPPEVGPTSHQSIERVDLPTITGQMSGVLASLRHEHGLAYTSGTWIGTVLPRYTSMALSDPALARDLLAAAALDAGGIRANVATIAASYPHATIVGTCVTLLEALEVVQIACESANGELPRPQPSDPTGWPADIG